MIQWQSIKATGERWVRDTGRGSPLRQLLTGVVFLILLAIFLIPVVILGALILVVMLIRGIAQGLFRMLAGTASTVLPRDDGRRNVKVRTPEREE